jgi:hypothetical protein
MIMVTKHTRTHWPFEPSILDDDAIERAYLKLLEDEEAPQRKSPLAWCVYGMCLLLAGLAGWHFVASWLEGAPL